MCIYICMYTQYLLLLLIKTYFPIGKVFTGVAYQNMNAISTVHAWIYAYVCVYIHIYIIFFLCTTLGTHPHPTLETPFVVYKKIP